MPPAGKAGRGQEDWASFEEMAQTWDLLAELRRRNAALKQLNQKDSATIALPVEIHGTPSVANEERQS
jgi:hypothetical protein